MVKNIFLICVLGIVLLSGIAFAGGGDDSCSSVKVVCFSQRYFKECGSFNSEGTSTSSSWIKPNEDGDRCVPKGCSNLERKCNAKFQACCAGSCIVGSCVN